ncbi:hypothetical protein [Pseudonocardia sp. ICBG1142]|uniref:hypothetical protein n=1 Tax=Pseudonocardia sp. ICBG1142 TaxID=2846760 RepID=UPI001CF64F9E|nr:hypothetical protein [Pseudonocardia sp. ICBG1142]
MNRPETVEVLAQLSTEGAVTWITDNVFKIVLLFIVVVLFVTSLKQDLGKIFTIVSGVLVAMVVLGFALTDGAIDNTATWLSSLFTGGN